MMNRIQRRENRGDRPGIVGAVRDAEGAAQLVEVEEGRDAAVEGVVVLAVPHAVHELALHAVLHVSMERLLFR